MWTKAWLKYIFFNLITPLSKCQPCRPLSPWIDVFALLEKINMHVTERDQGLKNAHNFLMTVRAVSWACMHVTEMLLILNKIFLIWLLGKVLDMTV